MIVTSNVDNIITNLNNIKQFTIKVDKKSFEVLYKNLYSDKIGAIVRELSSNARDSHIEANKKDLPIRIHLPNILEPFFEVEDFGLGMEENFIYDTYTKIFESTKVNTNLTLGYFGLGSKTPFAYSDQFTIKSIYNKFLRTYVCFLDENGTPSISKINEQNCDYCNGVSIKMAVKQQDFKLFNDKVKQYLKYFKPFPTIVGGYIEFPKREPWIEGENFICYKDRGENKLIMGCVPYNINCYEFSHDGILNIGTDIFVNIGEVDINPNREVLDYTNKTRDTIYKKIEEIKLFIIEYAKKQIEQSNSLWQANISYQKLYQNELSFLRQEQKYNGKKLFLKLAQYDFSCAPKILKLNKSDVRSKKTHNIYDFTVPIFIQDDIKYLSKIKHYLNENNLKSCYILNVKDIQKKDHLPHFFKDTGIKEVLIKASTLPCPPKKSTEKRIKREFIQVYRWKNNQSINHNYMYNWECVNVDLKPKKNEFYVVIKRGIITKHSLTILKDRLNIFKNKLVVIGIENNKEKRFKKLGWREFFDFTDNHISKIDVTKIEKAKKWSNFNYKHFIEKCEKIDKNSTLGKFVVIAKEYKKIHGKYFNYINSTNVIDGNDLNIKFEKVIEKYPMLSFVSFSYINDIEPILEYIRIIDKIST